MSALVTQARTYLGTPYRHRGRSAAGLDCAGLPWLCYSDLGVVLFDQRRYGREPHRDGLMAGISKALGEPIWRGGVGNEVARDLLQVGDVVVLRFVAEPHHLAIVGDNPHHGLSLIHAYSAVSNGCVVEHGLDAHWQSLIVAVFRRAV